MLSILFIISEDWYFVSHRLFLAKAAIMSGNKVVLLSHFTEHRDIIEAEGIKTIDWPLDRSSKNPFKEIDALKKVFSTIRKLQPSIIHSVGMKPVLYSAIASVFAGFKKNIFALAGLGYVFTSNNKSAKLLRPLLEGVFKLIFRGKKKRLILQNPEDKNALLSANIINPNNVRLIRGAGVDTQSFNVKPIPSPPPIITLPSRMLWAKGIQDFIVCAKEINKVSKIARFVLVGSPDVQNPDAIPIEMLEDWNNNGVVEWWGHQNNMPNVLHQSTIVCLPTSYGEGLPKCLLEAASCGRPIVTYDVPGCREIVIDGYNGFLVKAKRVDDLISAISNLLDDRELCIKMGKNGRKLVEKHFTQEKIAKETMAVWEELLAS